MKKYRTVYRSISLSALATTAAAMCLFTTPSHAVTIDMVTIGNPGNAPDTEVMICCSSSTGTTGYGSVGYHYRIGKYEVTAGQYTEFLNAVAKADPNELYNTEMEDPMFALGANIQRAGSTPNYIYSVDAEWADRSVNYVSFWDAARFANWLHNYQPTGPQGPGTTEDGAYLNIGNQAAFARQPGARFVIPSEDEWYKAAYHKNDGVTGNYWEYPTESDAAPINTLPDPGNHANFLANVGAGDNDYTIGIPYYRTEVGAFENSASPYGTFDQGGNVWEWNETILDVFPSEDSRGLRGGSFNAGSLSELASVRSFHAATGHVLNFGFRVASPIPEPGSITLCVVGVITLMLRRRTR